MLLANEAVGGLLARARRPALYRVHEHPKHEALLALADRLRALGLPVVPLPERANGPAGVDRRRPAGGAARADRARAAGRRARPSAPCSCARSSWPATTRSTRATPRSPRRPTCISRRRSGAIPTSSCTARSARSRASARTRRRRATCPRSRSAARAASARRPTPSAAPMRSAWPSCSRSGCGHGLAADVRRRRHRAHRGRPVRALRRRSSRASCRRGGSTRASASTSTSTAWRSSAAASGRRIRLGDELSCVVTAVDPPRGRATLDIVPEHDTPRARTRPVKKTTPRRPPKPPKRRR